MEPPSVAGPVPKGSAPAPVTKLAVAVKADDPFDPAIARAMAALDRNSALLTEEYLKALRRVETVQADVALASMRRAPPPPGIDEATIPAAEVFAPFAAAPMPATTIPTLKDVPVNPLPKSWKASRLIGGSAAPDAATIKLVAENFARQLTSELSALSINTALETEIADLKKRATEVQALRRDLDAEIKKRRAELDKTINDFVQALSRLASITGGSAASGILSKLPEQIGGVWAGVAPGQTLDSALTRITQILYLAAGQIDADLGRVRAAVGAVGSLESAAAEIGRLNAQLAGAENSRAQEANLRAESERRAALLLEENGRAALAIKEREAQIEALQRGLRDSAATAEDLRSRLKSCEDSQADKEATIASIQADIERFKTDLASTGERASKEAAERGARQLQELDERRQSEMAQLLARLKDAVAQERLRALEALVVAIRAQDLAAVSLITEAAKSRSYGTELAEIQRNVNDFERLKTLGANYADYSAPVIAAITSAASNPAAPYKYATDPYLVGRVAALGEVLRILSQPDLDVAKVRQVAEDPKNAPYRVELDAIAKNLDTVAEANARDAAQARELRVSVVEEVKKARENSIPYRGKPKDSRPVEDAPAPSAPVAKGDGGSRIPKKGRQSESKVDDGNGGEEGVYGPEPEDDPSGESPSDAEVNEPSGN